MDMAGSVLFDTRKGDINVPALTPASTALPLGSYDGPVGALTPSPVAASTLDATTLGSITAPNATVSALHVDTGTKIASATGTGATGAATLNKMSGVITTAALTTAAGASYALTIANSDIAAADIVMADVQFGTATTGSPGLTTVATAAGSVVITVQNFHASAAVNGTLLISFVVFKN
jgi:hypothetical protein